MKRKFKEVAKIYDKRDRVISVGKRNPFAVHPMVAHCHKQVGQAEYKMCAGFDALIKLPSMKTAKRIVIKRIYNDGQTVIMKPSEALEYALKRYTKIKL